MSYIKLINIVLYLIKNKENCAMTKLNSHLNYTDKPMSNTNASYYNYEEDILESKNKNTGLKLRCIRTIPLSYNEEIYRHTTNYGDEPRCLSPPSITKENSISMEDIDSTDSNKDKDTTIINKYCYYKPKCTYKQYKVYTGIIKDIFVIFSIIINIISLYFSLIDFKQIL